MKNKSLEDEMNQKELVGAVAEQCDMPKTQVKEVMDTMLECIQETLVDGDSVQFIGFGTFGITERAARQGRNPSTGKAMKIAASKGVKFKVGAKLKDAVKNS